MKKNLVRTILVVAMAALLLIGCGKEEVAQTTLEPQKEEEQLSQTQEKEEQTTEEVVAEQQTEEQVEKEQEIVEEQATETNQPITDSTPINEWIYSYQAEDTNQELKFVIYNEVEGYKLLLNNGDSYNLKKDDKLCLYYPKGMQEIRFLDPTILLDDLTQETEYNTRISFIFVGDKESIDLGIGIIPKTGEDEEIINCTFYKATE